jgi:DNA-directed RNA polymerase subunit RPC12/RpoP
MSYQCIYCKASYNHDQSYKHNAYDCPRVRGKGMKKALSVLLIGCLIALSGCEAIKGLLSKDEYPAGSNRAELTIHDGETVHKYNCIVNRELKSLTDCVEVQ